MSEALPFEEVYRRHVDDIYRFCLFQLRDPAEAEDVTADAFVSAFSAYQKSPPNQDKLKVWLIKIARNDVIDRRRRAQRWRAVLSKFQYEQTAPPSDVESLVQLNHRLREVLDVARALPKRDRLLIGLRIGADLSFEEISSITGISTKTAATATYRALEKIRKDSGVVIEEVGMRHA